MPTSGKQGPTAVGESPAALLEEFSEKWNVSGDVADASVVTTHDEDVTRRKRMELHADESVEENAVMPRTAYEREVGNRVPLVERYSNPPNGEDATVEFIEHDQSPETCGSCRGKGRTTCGRCSGNGRHQCKSCNGAQQVTCSDCRGNGTENCSRCRGSGTITNDGDDVQCPNCAGAGEHQCSRCSGSGKHTCTECGGDGRVTCDECSGDGEVTCSTCEGDGETVEATKGAVSFTYSAENEFDTDRVPERFVPDSGGEKVDVTAPITKNVPDELGGESTFHEEVSTFVMPATTVEYRHDGSEYEFHAIEDELRAKSFPKSGKRKAVTYAGIALLVAAVLGGLYYLGYLPV